MIFIPAYDIIMFMDLAYLFVLYIFSKHSIFFYVTSDRSLEFVSNFFHFISTVLNMWLHFTSGYYPKNDGQTKHIDQTLEQYLHIYCNYQQNNWFKLLSLVEFSYNNTPSATTSVFLFFANKGYHPNITVYSKHNIAFF